MHDDAAWKRVRMRVRSNERERSRWIALAQVVTRNELWWVIERTAIPAWEGRVGGISMGRRRKRIRLDVVFGADDQAKGRKDEDNGYEGQYVGHWHYLDLR